MTELIKRLRTGASISRDRNLNLDYAKVADEAADTIERQAAEIEQLRKERDEKDRQVAKLYHQLEQLRKAQGEPAAFYDIQERRFYWATPVVFEGVPVTVTVDPIPLYRHPAPEQVEQLKAEIERLNQVSEMKSERIAELQRQLYEDE